MARAHNFYVRLGDEYPDTVEALPADVTPCAKTQVGDDAMAIQKLYAHFGQCRGGPFYRLYSRKGRAPLENKNAAKGQTGRGFLFVIQTPQDTRDAVSVILKHEKRGDAQLVGSSTPHSAGGQHSGDLPYARLRVKACLSSLLTEIQRNSRSFEPEEILAIKDTGDLVAHAVDGMRYHTVRQFWESVLLIISGIFGHILGDAHTSDVEPVVAAMPDPVPEPRPRKVPRRERRRQSAATTPKKEALEATARQGQR